MVGRQRVIRPATVANEIPALGAFLDVDDSHSEDGGVFEQVSPVLEPHLLQFGCEFSERCFRCCAEIRQRLGRCATAR